MLHAYAFGDRLARSSVREGLGAPEAWSKSARIPSQLRGYDHLGDLDYHDGRLYVPLEGAAPAIGVFDSDLNYITHSLLPNALDAPWCAINPVDGHLYTSSFRTGVVRKHRMSWTGNGLALPEVASIALRDSAGEPLTLQRVQGGVFSASGHLYLVSDVPGQGIKGFAQALPGHRAGPEAAPVTGTRRRSSAATDHLAVM